MNRFNKLFSKRKTTSEGTSFPTQDISGDVVGTDNCPHCDSSIEFEIPPGTLGTQKLHSFHCPKCNEIIYFMNDTMYK
jgi:hypothetical protein